MSEKFTRLDKLVNDIFTSQDEIGGSEIDQQISLAAQDLLTDEESQHKYPQLWQYFELDANAKEKYRMLMRIERAEREEQLFDTVHKSEALVNKRPDLWIPEALHKAMAAGQHWVQDALGRISLLLGGPLQVQLPYQSGELAEAIYQDAFSIETNSQEWQVRAAAFPKDESTCFVDVTVSTDDFNANLGNIPVTLQIREPVVTLETNENGYVRFPSVSRAELDQRQILINIYPS